MNPYEYDESIRKNGFGSVAGVDEAGRGPLAGPVVAAAVILPEDFRVEGVRDSKKIPRKEREELFWAIVLNARSIGIGIIDQVE
ncbi:MAG TPA: ribonuclease HII, partial [Nitrospiraceae bacterium]|nr:ribonuclease HII [Nitrospiraceae bacterium]